MQEEHIKAVRERRRRVRGAAPIEAVQANVLDRAFTPEKPDTVRTAKITGAGSLTKKGTKPSVHFIDVRSDLWTPKYP
ncbi:MAG: hypothetical protein BMS9Abin05_2161 [Rhodothermia bacterium]|nr:MAG: hypothetical protein BMS9Abin05_2161 [Rhodothermia bacterium]